MPFPPDIQTARINELPGIGAFGPLAREDKFAVWLSAFNKTCNVDMGTIQDLIQLGGAGTFQPVILGDKYIHVVTAGEAGGTIVSLPVFAGKSFFLERDGQPLLVTEFEILSAGGFQIDITDPATGETDKLVLGQRFVLTFYELQGGTQSSTNKASLVAGKVVISTNLQLTKDDHLNKLLQFRCADTAVTVTLMDIADAPDNTILIFESAIGNTVQNKIQGHGGQKIYMNNKSWDAINLGVGESVSLFRDDDGWYVIGDFGNIYRNIGKPYPGYSAELDENEYALLGQDVAIAAVPRLYQKIQTLGLSVIDIADWPNNKGCYAMVDANTIRLPDFTKMFLRGISIVADADRPYNHPGGTQDEAVNISANVTGVKVDGLNTVGATDTVNPTGLEYNLAKGYAISPKQGTETRPVNTGVLWVIKV